MVLQNLKKKRTNIFKDEFSSNVWLENAESSYILRKKVNKYVVF